MEDNRLIAEFMGAVFDDNGMTRICDKGGRVSDLNLQYHTSWDWLMPVVQKITQETKEFKEGRVDSCLYTPIASALIRWTDRDLVYDAVVEFIKEFN